MNLKKSKTGKNTNASNNGAQECSSRKQERNVNRNMSRQSDERQRETATINTPEGYKRKRRQLGKTQLNGITESDMEVKLNTKLKRQETDKLKQEATG